MGIDPQIIFAIKVLRHEVYIYLPNPFQGFMENIDLKAIFQAILSSSSNNVAKIINKFVS